MAKALHCADFGFKCDAVMRGKTVEEVLGKAARHAADAHGLKELPPEVVEKAKGLIREEKAD